MGRSTIVATGSDYGEQVTATGSPLDSTYSFFAEVVGYDLAALFERNRGHMKRTVDAVVRALLDPDYEA